MNTHKSPNDDCPSGSKRVVIHDYAAHPFTLELAHSLVRRGHRVAYLHGGALRSPRADMTSGDGASLVDVRAVDVRETPRTAAGPRRLLQEHRYGRALGDEIRRLRPDLVISNGALDIQAAAQRATHGASAAFVLWLQDVYYEAIARLVGRRVPFLGGIAAWRFAQVERRLARSSEAIVAITEDFLPILRAWNVPEERVTVIENWAPLTATDAGAARRSWGAEHGLGDRPLLLYTGTLGRKHNPSLLIELAEARPEADVAVVGEGVGMDQLRAAARPSNLALLPLQPADRLSDMLASADVLVVLLQADAGVFSVPSKILSYLAAGRPILAAIPADNLAARTIHRAEAGVVVDPAEGKRFVEAAGTLLDDEPARSRMGSAGRAYAERTFKIERITDEFEAVIARACAVTTRWSAAKTDTGDNAKHVAKGRV